MKMKDVCCHLCINDSECNLQMKMSFVNNIASIVIIIDNDKTKLI